MRGHTLGYGCYWAVAFLWGLGSSGCLWTSRGEGASLKKRVSALEGDLTQERNKLAEQLVDAQDKITRLEELLDRATRVLAQNNTDMELRVQQLEEQADTTRGGLSEAQNHIDALQKTSDEHQKLLSKLAENSSIEPSIDASEIPARKEAHFDAARAAYGAGEYNQARSLDREYVRRYPKDGRADDAQYWIGAGYLEQKKPATALGEWRKVIATYPKSDMLDKTLFNMAEAFWQLQACTDAKGALKALIDGHKQSPLRKSAQQKLKKIKQAQSGYCTS
ncbi:MAG: tetratricopeptide repeat protein [Myxococcales bacterium]|nr:tetratricopeptide repeat protein [Myxococcales bacterium]MCB9707921.1 tetratricopeptide repeat protein [Myxococcales bacterium]